MVGVQVLPTLCFYHHYMCIYADLVRQYDELKLKDNKFYDVELPRFSQASTVYTRISNFLHTVGSDMGWGLCMEVYSE